MGWVIRNWKKGGGEILMEEGEESELWKNRERDLWKNREGE